MPNDNLKKYYDYLKANNADVAPTYDAFANALSDENNAKKYHSYLLNNGFDAPKDYNVFVNRLGLVKKKEVSQSTPKKQVTSLDGSKTEKQKHSESLSSANRWANVTQPRKTPEKYKTDDYIDIIENKPLKKNTKVSVKTDTYVPEVEVQTIDAPSEKEAETMMQEDFGKKEFDSYQKIKDIDANILFKTEEEAVEELRKKFKGSGFIFEETGVGNKIRISTSTNGGLTTINSKEFELMPSITYGQSQTGMPLNSAEALKKSSEDKYNEIVDFMSKSILKKTDKDFLTKDVKDYGQLVNLMADNPYKYGENFLDQYSTDRWFDNQYNELVIESKSLKRDEDILLKEYNDYKNNPYDSNKEVEIKNKLNSLQERKDILKSKYEDLNKLNGKLKTSSAVYYSNKEKQGNIAGLISKSFIKGAFNMEKALASVVADVMPHVLPKGSIMPDVQREKLKATGMSDFEIDDYASKQLRKQIIPQIEKGLTDLVSFGTTDEYIQSKDRSDLERVGSFLSESIGTALSAGGNPGLQKIAFFTQSYNAIEDEMNTKQFDGLNQFEKKLISVPYGLTIGALENLGFRFATGATKSKLFNNLVNNIVFRTFSELPKDASITMMQNELKRNTAAMLTKAGLQIVGGALVEGSVEGAQQLDEIAIKNISNAITDKDYFQNVPDITTAKGINEAIGLAATDFYYGTLGGLIMSGGAQSVSAIREGYSNRKSDDEFSIFYNSIKDNNLRSAIESDIKSKIVNGDITKEEAKAQIESMNKSYSIIQSIPENLNIRNKRESFNLILEKQKIQKEIEGKDPALVAAQTDRINEINEELKTISKNAVQVETAGEIPVQPETRVGGEMEEGKPQAEPQVVTEEGEAAVQEEVTPIENKDVQEVLDRRKPMILSESDQKRMDEDPIGFTKEKLENLIDFVESKKDRSSVDEDMLQQYKRDYEILTSQQVEEAPIVQTTIREVPQQNLITEENVEQLRSQQTTPVAQKIFTAAKLAMKALPGVKIYVHNTTNEFDQAIGQKSAEGAKGAYVDGEIHINLENGADVVTMLHESMHHGLVVKGVESGAMTDLARGLKSVISDKALKQRLDDFISNYDGSEQAEEYLAELGGIMAEAKQELTTTKFQQFKNLINKIAQKLGLPTVFSAAANAKNAVDFMNSLTKSIRTGQEIKAEEVKKTGKVKFQADFSDPLSKLTFVYDKNGEKFDQLKKDGFITDDKVLSDFAGKFIFLHQPDAAFSGMIYKDGELLVEGKGGVFYPIKFHDDGYFWASTATTAEKMAKDLNKVFDQNNGTIYMALTSAPYDKLMSSTTMSNAILDFFSSKAFDNNFKITPAQLKVALRKAANDIKIQKIKDKKTGKVKEKKIGLDLKIKAESSLDEIQAQIKTALNPDIKSFADRKNFAEELIKLMADKIKNDPKATEQFGKLFSEGIQNKYFKGISKTGKISISAANMTQAISEMFTEPLLKEDIDREKGGQVYAIVELNGKVKPEPSTKHESYPMAIESENKTNKVKIHILQDRQNWADSFIDPETGETISEDRQKKLFPTSGVSTMGLELKGKSKPKFQKTAPNGKPSNLNDKQWEQVRTPEFKKWFGDWENDPANASKVVDENGEPLVVYHGSLGEFDEFETQLLGSRTGSRSAKKGFFFSDDKRVADSYIYFGQLQNPNIDDLKPIIYGMTREQLGDFQSTVLGLYDDSDSYSDEDLEYLKDDIFGAVEYDSEQHMLDSLKYIEKAEKFIKSRNINKEFSAYPKGYIYESFLNIKNPFEQDLNNDVFDDTYTLDVSNKNDGIILTNAIDSFSAEEKSGGIESTIIVAFEPNQIKSATENVGTFSAETRNIKFQKATTQKEAIQKAKDKYTLSVEQRGNPHQQGVDAALNDLRKSDWYKTTDDTQRENAERELKEFFGEKLKKAPSVAKVLGKPKAKQVSVNEMSALKDQIRLEAKAAREAKGDLNAKRKALATAISSMVKTGKIKAAQAGVIIKRISNLNLDNPVLVERFVDYASKVFDRADYQERLDNAFKLRKAIRKALKTDNQAEVVGMAKEFTKIDPSMVEDIDAYIAMAEKVVNAVKPSRVKGLDVVMKEAANIAEISEYSKKEIDRQEQIRIDELLATYDYLEDISEGMSFKELQDIVNLLKEKEDANPEKQEKVMEFLKARMDTMAGVLEPMLKDGIDPMTGEEITFDDKQKDLMKRALKIDLNEMSIREAIKIVESIDNFLNNQITSGLEAAVSSYEGAMNDKQLVQKGFKAKSLKFLRSGKIGRGYTEQLFSLPLMIEKMFGGINKSIEVMNKWGLSKLINGVNKANKQFSTIIDSYTKQPFYSTKNSLGVYVMNKGFMDAENVYERAMLSFLKRNLIGTQAEMKSEFERRVRIIKESIDVLIQDGNSKEKKMGELYKEVYNKLNVDSIDMNVIESNASDNNIASVNWWINQWSKHYPDLSDISLSVYNTILGSDLNYTTDNYKLLSSEEVEFDKAAVERKGSFAISIDYTDKNKTGVLMETTRPETLPRNEKGEVSRYISLDFDANNAKALKAALVDINTASAIRQIDGFMSSNSFKKLIPDSDDRKIITKRINTYIRRAKGKNIVPSDTMQDVERFGNFITALGVGKALGGVSQAVTQTIPVMLNTVLNAGRFDIADAEFNAWLDDLGVSTSNRGLESQSTVESIDRQLEASNGNTQKIIKGVENLSQFYLKQFLSRPDVFVARSSFKSYYLQNLKRRGISTDIDWKTHKPDMEAVEYAEAMVNRQQNVSDPLLAGEFLASDEPMRKISRKAAFPFASFILNQKARMYNDLSTIASSTATKEDKIAAGRSLAGLAVELAAFQLIGFGIRRLYDSIAASLLGDEDDEETKKKKMLNATKYPVKSIVNDIVSPFPGMTDKYVTWGLNEALSFYPWMDDKEVKDAVKERNKILELKGEDPMDAKTEAEFIKNIKNEATYQVFEDDDRSGGMYGIALNTYNELFDISELATTGKFTDEYQGRETTKVLLDSDREKVKYAVPFMIAYSTGLLPKDVGTISKNYVNRIKKKAVTENQYERYEGVQKDLGRNLKSWEIQLVKDKKETETAIDEIKFIENNGGLTERQGREYLKLMKAIGEPSVSDIVRIKEGQTANQILK